MTENTPASLSEEAQTALEVLEEILRQMSFPATVEVSETSDQVLLNMTSNEPLGLLIGKGGQTLNALELLIRTITQQKLHIHGKRVVVDAEGYRTRQTQRLVDMAHAAARQVLESGECVPLEPMTARDRRTVHMAALEIEGVESFSVGEEPYRHIVLCPPGEKPEGAE